MARQVIPRSVYLAVLSDTMTADQISDFVGVQPDRAVTKGEVAPDSVTGRPFKWTKWKLLEQGSSSADISQLVSVLHGRILPIAPELRKLRQAGCDIFFQFALYHSPADDGGSGFMLDARYSSRSRT